MYPKNGRPGVQALTRNLAVASGMISPKKGPNKGCPLSFKLKVGMGKKPHLGRLVIIHGYCSLIGVGVGDTVEIVHANNCLIIRRAKD